MDDVHTIDCHYLDRPRYAAAYLIVDGDEAAFVDNNTQHALPRLLSTLETAGYKPEQVRYLIVTHVHLDHAGGTSALAEACPQATVVAHPRAVRHIIDPGKLVDSASAVYGAESFKRMYGCIEPIAEPRVRAMADGERLTLGQRTLCFLHTRGHANHHFCIADSASEAVFTGDAFGLHYPDLQGPGPFAFPSTSPTDFDAELARQSIRRIVACHPRRLYPTHFGAVEDIATTAAQLVRHLDFAEQLVSEAVSSDVPDAELAAVARPRLCDYFRGQLDQHGGLAAAASTWELIGLDIDLNAQGIASAAMKQRAKTKCSVDGASAE